MSYDIPQNKQIFMKASKNNFWDPQENFPCQKQVAVANCRNPQFANCLNRSISLETFFYDGKY